MNLILSFILGMIAGGAIAWLVLHKTQPQHTNILKYVGTRKKSPGLLEKQAKEKGDNKQRILEILKTQSPLTNNHIEQLLGISDATATCYLEEFEKEGRVRQVGKTGRHVYYEKV